MHKKGGKAIPQHIIVTPYNPDWPRMFRQEAETVGRILGDGAVCIFHIGSTAVEGLAAKPIIDMMPVVRSLKAADDAAAAFEAAGYEYLGEFGIPGRRYLRKGGDEQTHQIHIFAETDRENIVRHLAVRDYLKAHADERRAYAALKTELAARFPYDIDGYCDGKEAFVKALEERARKWYREAHGAAEGKEGTAWSAR